MSSNHTPDPSTKPQRTKAANEKMKLSGSSNVNYGNLNQLILQRVLELEQSNNIPLTKQEQFLQEIEHQIAELRKRITAQNQGAPPILETSSDTLSDADDQKREHSVTLGVPFLPSFTRSPPTPSVTHTQMTLNELAPFHNCQPSLTHGMFSVIIGHRGPGSVSTPKHQVAQQDRVIPIFNIEFNEPKAVSKPIFEKESPKSKSFGYGEYLEYWRQGKRNSVREKYEDLKEELTSNNVARISEKKYKELYRKAEELLTKKPLVAKPVGDTNGVCGIDEGSAPKVEHIIALLIYTDFNHHQCAFKKQCRKMSADESLQDLVDKNREIYHWSKLIKELCIFYGEIMGENDVLYTGMGEYLMFDSLCTRFECPISTSTKLDVAKRFSDGAIILKFKRGSTNTRTLDVTEYSSFGTKESERLVAGSTLKIVDILINEKSHETYVSALRMLEQIMNGHFIDGDDKIVWKLVSLLEYAISPTLTDKLRDLDLKEPFFTFLKDEGHDSDSITEDITDETSSDISKCFGSSIFAEVQKCSNDHAATKHPKYIQEAVFCFLRKMKSLSEKGALWLNRRELAEPKYAQLHNVLVRYNGIFEHFGIGANGIREIQTFSWENSNESCDKRQYMSERKFRTKSKKYIYEFDKMNGSVQFQLYFYRQRIGKEIECSISFKIRKVNSESAFSNDSVEAEMDILCNCDGDVHRSLMRKQKLDTDTKKGIVVYRSENVNANSLISWKFAIRMEPKQLIEDHFPLDPGFIRQTSTQDRQVEMLREKYDELKENNDKLKCTHKVLKKDNDTLKAEYDELKKMYDELKENNDILKKDNINTLMELEHLKKEKDTEKGRLQEQSRRNSGKVQSKISFVEGIKRRGTSNTLAPNEPKNRGWRSSSLNFVLGRKDGNE